MPQEQVGSLTRFTAGDGRLIGLLVPRTSMVTARNVVAALEGRWPPDAVNQPESWRGKERW